MLDRIAKVWGEVQGDILKETLFKATTEAEGQTIAAKFIPSYLSIRNVIPLLLCAKGKYDSLARMCVLFIGEHFSQVVKTPDFQAMNEKSKMTLVAKIQDSTLFEGIFVQAIEEGDEIVFSLFLKKGVNKLDKKGYTMLDYTVREKHLQWTERLLKAGATPNPLPGSQAPPSAFSALNQGHGKLFWLLMKHGFKMSTSYQGEIVFEYATRLLSDPTRFAGIRMKVETAMKEGHRYKFSHEEFFLHGEAEATFNPNFSPDEFFEWGIRKYVIPPAIQKKIDEAKAFLHRPARGVIV